MDIARSFVAVVLCIGLLRSVDAGCKEDLTGQLNECIKGYSTFMTNSGGDVTQLCSAEGLAAMGCLTDLVSQCPDLAAVPGAGNMLSSIQQMGAACSGGGGGGAGGGDGAGGMMNPACMKAQECMTGMTGMTGMDGGQPPAGSSGGDMGGTKGQDTMGLSTYPPVINMMCGTTKDMFMCMQKYEKDCPEIMSSMKESMASGQGMPPGMTYEGITNFMKNTCPKMPSDFATNKCVMDKLNDANNDECVKEAAEGVDQPTCSDINNVMGCIALDECGSNYDSFFRESTSYFITSATNEKCDLTSASYPLRASVVTFITAVLLIVKLI